MHLVEVVQSCCLGLFGGACCCAAKHRKGCKYLGCGAGVVCGERCFSRDGVICVELCGEVSGFRWYDVGICVDLELCASSSESNKW